MRETTTIAPTEGDTIAAGRALGATLSAGATVLLYGDLGAGKTAFVRGLADGLGVDSAQVSSPTFTIVQEYRGPGLALQHVDLYRLSPVEVADLALDDLIDEATVMAIEWAEHLPRPPSGAIVIVRMSHAGDGRRITISSEHP